MPQRGRRMHPLLGGFAHGRKPYLPLTVTDLAHLPLGYSLHDDFISLHKRSMDDEVQIVLRTGSKCMDFTRLYH
jgi:hypothetical protein